MALIPPQVVHDQDFEDLRHALLRLEGEHAHVEDHVAHDLGTKKDFHQLRDDLWVLLLLVFLLELLLWITYDQDEHLKQRFGLFAAAYLK